MQAPQHQQQIMHGCVVSGVGHATAQRHDDTSRKELIMSTSLVSATLWGSSIHVLCGALVLMLTACSRAPTTPVQREAAGATPPAQVGAGAPATERPTALSSQASQDLLAQVDAYVDPLVAQDQFSGAIQLARAGEVLVSQGYGLANREHGVPNTPHTKFRIGSVTKQFTAMAILQLQQQGKLHVQDHICTYVPECPDAWQPITIHHLLTHTSGIQNFTDYPDYQKLKTFPTLPIQTIMSLKDKALAFEPGRRWSYSNSGYIILGYIIERVAGKPYALVLKDLMFDPLQMTSTGYDTTMVIIDRAAGYASPSWNAEYIDMSIPHAAGGLYSTVEDLYRWDQALYTEQFVPQAALDTMFTAHAPFPAPAEGGYGYGWDIFTAHDRRVTGHLGGIEGFSAGLTRFPDDQVTVIVLSNLEQVDVGKISMDLAAIVFEER